MTLDRALNGKPLAVANPHELEFDFLRNGSTLPAPNGMKPWSVRLDVARAERRSAHVCVTVTQLGYPKGLHFADEYGVISHTTRPISQAGVAGGSRIIAVGEVLVDSVDLAGRTNAALRRLLCSTTPPFRVVFQPSSAGDFRSLIPSGANWVRLFTDGGQRADVVGYGW